MIHGDHERPVFGCAECVAAASVGMSLEDGASVWRVELERRLSTVFYVVAATRAIAKTDANYVAQTLGASDLEDRGEEQLVVAEIWGEPLEDDVVWSGGPSGGWVAYRQEADA